MLDVVFFFDASPSRNLREFQRGWFAVEHKSELEAVIRHQAGCSIEEPRQVRRDSPVRILERRTVAQSYECEELIKLAIRIDRESLSAQVFERQRFLDDDR